MKIKQIPEDFIVEEITSINLKKKGRFSVYKLIKKNMDFIAARKTIARKFKISPKLISYAGIKDKIAVTTQYIAIKTDRGRKGNFNLPNISFEYIGFCDNPLKSGDLKGNKFTVTLRGITEDKIEKIKLGVKKISKIGFPNYFDSQRFGEDLSTGGFAAKRLMKGDYENALRIFLASTNNKSEEKNEAHRFIHKKWGKWEKCSEFLGKLEMLDEEKNIIRFLEEKPKDYATAFKLINRQKKELMVSSYQSFLWNKCLIHLLKENLKELKETGYKAGKLFFYEDITEEKLRYLASKEIPMIDPKTDAKDKEVSRIIKDVLEKEKISQKELKVKKISNLFFKERQRDSIIFPEAVSALPECDDELNRGKKAMKISFFLKKGSYATIFLKALELSAR